MVLKQLIKKSLKKLRLLKIAQKFHLKFLTLLEHYFAIIDSKTILKKNKKTLFVDCGSNIGQGFLWFSNYYNSENTTFHLFEPNPNCHTKLVNCLKKSGVNYRLFKSGIATYNGKAKLNGISDEGDPFFQGASLDVKHNLIFEKNYGSKIVEVSVINFSNYIKKQSKTFDFIVVKMDVEGAETDILNSLLDKKNMEKIDVIYIEFHSQYLKEPERTLRYQKEEEILNRLKKLKCKVRIWQ